MNNYLYHPPEGGGVVHELPETEGLVRGGKPPVLIIEDDLYTRMMLCAALGAWKYSVEKTRVGDSMPALRRACTFSLIIVDLQPQDARGYGVLHFLSTLTSRPPVIVISTAPSEKLALDSDVVKVIIRKPFDIQWLRECVDSLAGGGDLSWPERS